jgi:hypothetical protein
METPAPVKTLGFWFIAVNEEGSDLPPVPFGEALLAGTDFL